MKRLHNLLPMFAVLVAGHVLADGSQTNAWGSLTNSTQMSISIKPAIGGIQTNQSIVLLIHVRNASTNDILYLDKANQDYIHPDSGISLTASSPSGKDVSPEVEYYGISGGLIRISPNGVNEFEFDLGRSFRFTEVGTYTLIAKKYAWFGDGKAFEIVSNPLSITIAPGK